MNKEAFFYLLENKKILIFNKSGNFIKKKNFNKTNLSKEEKIGLICSEITKGNSLIKILVDNKNKSWTPSIQQFLIWIKSEEKFTEMYNISKDMRNDIIEEEMIETKEEKEIKSYSSILKILKEKKALENNNPKVQYILTDWRSQTLPIQDENTENEK